MFEIPLPTLKKYQRVSAVAAGLGFIIGALIPAGAIFVNNWQCPFGNGLLQIAGFLGVIGLVSGVVIGNLAALLLIGIAKWRSVSVNRQPSETRVPVEEIGTPHKQLSPKTEHHKPKVRKKRR